METDIEIEYFSTELMFGIGIAILVGIIFYIFSKKNLSSFESIDIDNCEKEYLFKWFRQPKIFNQLKEKDEYIAIVIKENHPLAKNIKVSSNKSTLIQCVFDEKRNEIIDAQILKCKSISEEIEDMFGNTDMLILN